MLKRFLIKPDCWFVLAILAFITLSTGAARAQEPSPFANCRLGVGGTTADLGDFDLGQLNMGLYLDWASRSNPALSIGLPAEVEYIQTVRVHQDKVAGWDSAYVDPPTYTVSPNLATLASRVAASPPGSIWRIGNEIERRDWYNGGQDEITPELYATAFHETRAVIKAADPTARVAIGSVIEATPLRLAYLDRVWASYFNQYGYSMGNDIDVYIVHGFLLREIRNSWGAEIPAGFDNSDADPNNNYDPTTGFLYGVAESSPVIVQEHHNIAHFIEFTTAFRAWLAAKGERNKPLINTEFGVLYDGFNGESITPQEVNAYMDAAFDYLFTAADPNTGYPADENRLVQGWVWYSLDDVNWNGYLFGSGAALSSFGENWRAYVSNAANPLASQPRQNLLVTHLSAEPNPAHILVGDSTTIRLKADIANSGNTPTSTGNNILVSFWDGDPSDPGSNQIGSSQILPDIQGCGRFSTVEVEWQRGAGTFDWYVKVEPVGAETNVNDNVASSTVSVIQGPPVAADEIYLPVVQK